MKIKPNYFAETVSVEEIQRKDNTKYTVRDNRQRFFFPDEWVNFFDALKPKQKVTFHFLINTGARINEVRHVKVSDIDFERQNIVFRMTKARNKDGTRRIRVVKISPEFTRYAKRISIHFKLKPNDYIPIHSTPASNIGMKKALQKVGIKDWQMFSVHNVRKTLETWLLALGIDNMRLVQHFGHSMQIAQKHYVSPDIFNYEDKQLMRKIIGGLYETN